MRAVARLTRLLRSGWRPSVDAAPGADLAAGDTRLALQLAVIAQRAGPGALGLAATPTRLAAMQWSALRSAVRSAVVRSPQLPVGHPSHTMAVRDVVRHVLASRHSLESFAGRPEAQEQRSERAWSRVRDLVVACSAYQMPEESLLLTQWAAEQRGRLEHWMVLAAARSTALLSSALPRSVTPASGPPSANAAMRLEWTWQLLQLANLAAQSTGEPVPGSLGVALLHVLVPRSVVVGSADAKWGLAMARSLAHHWLHTTADAAAGGIQETNHSLDSRRRVAEALFTVSSRVGDAQTASAALAWIGAQGTAPSTAAVNAVVDATATASPPRAAHVLASLPQPAARPNARTLRAVLRHALYRGAANGSSLPIADLTMGAAKQLGVAPTPSTVGFAAFFAAKHGRWADVAALRSMSLSSTSSSGSQGSDPLWFVKLRMGARAPRKR